MKEVTRTTLLQTRATPYDYDYYYERRRMTSEIETFTHAWVKKIGVMPFLNKLGWEEVGAAYMAPNEEIVNPIDMEEDDYETVDYSMIKLRLRLGYASADILVMRAALTSEALKVSGLTYTLRESARDEEVTDAIHIHIVNNGAYWNAVNAAEKVAKYGCQSCSNCEHGFDDWVKRRADGGNKKRPVVSHPLKSGMYRVLPCEVCPAKFREEFDSRMAADLAEREKIDMKRQGKPCY